MEDGTGKMEDGDFFIIAAISNLMSKITGQKTCKIDERDCSYIFHYPSHILT
jgi:hypothetical protein